MQQTQRILSVIAVFIAICCVACSKNSSVVVPFALGPAGATTAARIQVQEHLTYAATLRYEYKENDSIERARQWTLAGGSTKINSGDWIEPCAPLKILVKVHQWDLESLKPLAEEIVERPCLSSWGATSLDAELFAITLAPGSYEFTAESLEAAPSFVGARTSLHIGRAYRGK